MAVFFISPTQREKIKTPQASTFSSTKLHHFQIFPRFFLSLNHLDKESSQMIHVDARHETSVINVHVEEGGIQTHGMRENEAHVRNERN